MVRRRRNTPRRRRGMVSAIMTTPISNVRKLERFALANSSSKQFTWVDLPGVLGADSSTRITSIEFTCASDLPNNVLVSLNRADGVEVTSTKPIVTGTTPLRHVIRTPRGTDFTAVEPNATACTFRTLAAGTCVFSVVINYSVRNFSNIDTQSKDLGIIEDVEMLDVSTS